MTIQLHLQKETFLRDLETLKHIFDMNINNVEKLKPHYEPLNISTSEWNPQHNITINVTPQEFALIGMFNDNL